MVRYWVSHFKDEAVDHETFNSLTIKFQSKGMDHMSLNDLGGYVRSNGRLHFALNEQSTWYYDLRSAPVFTGLFRVFVVNNEVVTGFDLRGSGQ